MKTIPSQTEQQAETLRMWQASKINMHRVDTSQLGYRDGRAVGGCRTDKCQCDVSDFNCNQGRNCPEREYDDSAPLMTMLELFAIVMIIGGFFLLSYSYIR